MRIKILFKQLAFCEREKQTDLQSALLCTCLILMTW